MIHINKLGMIFSALCFLSLSTDTMGFDIYAHGVMYYFYDYILNHTDMLFNEIVMPRYLLLSYIFEVSRRVGIPLGIVVTWIVCYPTYNVAVEISKRNKNKINIADSAILFSMVLLSFNYSGISLVLLWMIALIVTKNPKFLIGAFFHPVGLTLATLLIVVKRLFLFRYILIFILFLIFLFINTRIAYFTSARYYIIRYDITYDLTYLSTIIETIIETKFNEIIMLLMILVISILAKSKLKSFFERYRNLSLNRSALISSLSIILLSLNIFFLFKDRHNLLIDMLQFNISEPIYATWFDWGERDLIQTNDPRSLFNKRFDDTSVMQ